MKCHSEHWSLKAQKMEWCKTGLNAWRAAPAMLTSALPPLCIWACICLIGQHIRCEATTRKFSSYSIKVFYQGHLDWCPTHTHETKHNGMRKNEQKEWDYLLHMHTAHRMIWSIKYQLMTVNLCAITKSSSTHNCRFEFMHRSYFFGSQTERYEAVDRKCTL